MSSKLPRALLTVVTDVNFRRRARGACAPNNFIGLNNWPTVLGLIATLW